MERKLKKQWVLTQAAFDRLLVFFDADREYAGEKYEILRLKLIKYFEWQDSLTPEELADETINRVARKIIEGEVIQNLNGYVFGTARHLASEQRKDQQRRQIAFKQLPDYLKLLQSEDIIPRRLECCEICLSSLSEKKRELIIAYYSLERRAKIGEHQRMADELSISLNSLRLRVHRVKLELEKCIVECENKNGGQ